MRPGASSAIGAMAACAVAFAMLLAGCGGTVPESRIYSIDTAYDGAEPGGAPAPLTLQIPPFTSSDVYSDRRIAWRDRSEPHRIRRMDNNLWSAAPARLVRRFGFSGGDETLSGFVMEIDLVLTGREPRRLLWQDSFRHEGKVEADDSAAAIAATAAGFQALCRHTRETLRGHATGEAGS